MCWGHLGVSWKPTVSILRPTGAVSVHFELLWGRLCHSLIFWVNCGASRIHSEWFWGHSHVSGAIPGPFVSVWAHLTSAWVTLRRFWSIRSDVGALWGKFLCVVRLFGAISVRFGQRLSSAAPRSRRGSGAARGSVPAGARGRSVRVRCAEGPVFKQSGVAQRLPARKAARVTSRRAKAVAVSQQWPTA